MKPDANWIFEHVRSYIDEQLRLQQAEMDRRVETVGRELDAIRELYDRVLAEREKALQLAEHERTEAANVLRQKLEEQIESLRRELSITNDASEKAIEKAETASERRFESVNEWRAQSLDRERSTSEERAKLEGSFLRRETFETWKGGVEQQLNQSAGEKVGATGERRERRAVSSQTIAWVGVGLTVVWVLIAIASVALATHGFK